MSGLTLTPLPITASSQSWGSITVESITSGTALNLDTNPRSLYANEQFVSAGVSGYESAIQADATGKGTSPAGAVSRVQGLLINVKDDPSVGNKTVSGAVNNGSGLIRLTVTGHGYSTGDSIGVYGVGGTTEANGRWTVTVIDANTIDLQGSSFSHAYTSGGTATNRGVLYGGLIAVSPAVARSGLTGTAQNGDDVNGLGVFNGGAGTATSGFLVNHNASGPATEFFQGVEIEANCTAGVRMTGAYTWGIDLYGSNTATYSGAAIRLPRGGTIYGRKGDDTTDLPLCRIRSDTNEFELMGASRLSGTLSVTDGVNFDFGPTNGTKFGLSTADKIGFFNATPVTQQSAVGTATGYSAGTTAGTFHTDDKYTGNVGTTAYTINGIVAALKNYGFLAS